MNRKILLAKKRAVKMKLQSDTETNQLKLFDFIYFNPKDNPLPNSVSKKVVSKSAKKATNVATDQVISIVEEKNSSENLLTLSDFQNDRVEEENVDNQNLEPVSENTNGGNLESSSENLEQLSENTNEYSDASSDEYTDLAIAPQLKIGSDGQLVIDEESLSIKTTVEKLNKNVVIETVEESGDTYQFGKYNKKRKRTTDWTSKETAIFYKALSIVGTDFLMMQSLLKWRSRIELKLKFKKEERLHKQLVVKALSDDTQFDFSSFTELDYDPEEDRRTAKIEIIKRKKELIKEKKKKLHEDKIKEKKEMMKQKKERKQLLRQTFKPRRGLKRSRVYNIDEDSNDSMATSILVDPEEVIFEMTLLDKDTDELQSDSIPFDNNLREDQDDFSVIDFPDVEPSSNTHSIEETVGEPSPSSSMKETWFDVSSIRTDELNKNFVELTVDDTLKRIPVPAVQEDTSHVVVVATFNQSNDTLYHVYLASCNNQNSALSSS